MRNRSKSRKQTPWDNKTNRTATQEYVQIHYVRKRISTTSQISSMVCRERFSVTRHPMNCLIQNLTKYTRLTGRHDSRAAVQIISLDC